MCQFLVGIQKCCKIFFPCNAMVSSNIILIDVYFVIIPETGSGSAKIINKFLSKEPLKHLPSLS